MPRKVCGGDILHVMAFGKKFEMPQNRTVSVFHFFSVRNLITCLIFEMPHFFKLEIFEMPHFRNIGSIRTNSEKLKLFDFGVFQNFLQMPSRAKYLLHILFGAFQLPSRIPYH